MRWISFERRLLGGASLLLLLAWLTACITDVNHPPGARTVRLVAVAFVLLLGLLESLRPWWGFLLAAVLMPHMLIFKHLAATYLSPVCAQLPEFWAGPWMAALTVGYFWRCERSACKGFFHNAPVPAQTGRRWVRACRVTLWLLVAAIGIGTVSGLVHIQQHPPGWIIQPVDLRHLLLPGLFVDLKPVLAAAEWIPPLLLTLLLLNAFAVPAGRGCLENRDFPARAFAAATCLSFAMVALAIITQRLCHWHFPFDLDPPSGPFAHRNTAAPLMALAGLMALVLGTQRTRRWFFLGISALCIAAVLSCSSKNGVLTLVVGLGILSFLAMGRWRWHFASVGATLLAAALLWLPLPKGQPDADADAAVVQRVCVSIQAWRAGDLPTALTYRTGYFAAAWNIAGTYPWNGAGLGTFPMLASKNGQQGNLVHDFAPGEVALHAHCLPLQLLAETGVLGALAWTALMLCLPLWRIATVGKNRWLALIVVAGAANLFDCVWLSPGAAFFLLITIPLACREDDACLESPSE